MATLREAIYDIKEMFSVYSDDTLLSEEHIAYSLKLKRALYLRNYLSNITKSIPLEAKQLICINLEEDELCEEDILFLKSTIQIPSTIEATGRANISDVFLNSRLAKYINIIDYIRIPYIMGGRRNNNQIYITIDPNNYLILFSLSGNHQLINQVKLNIVAEDPEEADKLSCETGEDSCDYYDKQFPIELSMLDMIKKEILNELIIKYRIPVDTVNNTEDDTVNKNKLDADRRSARTKA
jgi:hypothetical protein